MGLFFFTACAYADVAFNGTTFTGSGVYDQSVNSTSNLVATPDDNAKITFSNNIVTTGAFTLNRYSIEFAENTTSSFGAFSTKNTAGNGSSAIINGNVQMSSLSHGHSKTSYLIINNGATLTVKGDFWLAESDGAQGIVTQNGGTVSLTTSGDTAIRIGHWFNKNYPSEYNLKGGVLNVPNAVTHVGWDAYAKLNISGGEANLKGINLSAGGKKVNKVNGGRGYLNLTGGTLNLGSAGVTYTKKKNTSIRIAPEIKLGAGTVNALESHTWASNLTVTLTGTTEETATVFNANSGKTITLASVVNGNGGLIKTGDGTLTLSARNTFTGGMTIQNGKVISNAANAEKSAFGTGKIIVESGTTLEFQVSNQLGYSTSAPNDITIRGTFIPSNYTHIKNITLENGIIESEYGYSDGGTGLDFRDRIATIASTGNSVIKSRFTIGSNAKPTFNVQSGVLTIEGVIKSDGGFTKTGDGTLTLSGANTYTGKTIVSDGVLKLVDNAVVSNGSITVEDAGALEFNLSNEQTKKLTVGDSNKIVSTGKIIKTGAGTLQINAAQDAVDVQSLVVSSGRLDMKEYFKGSMEVGEALDDAYTTATFSPGNSVGTLIIDGAFKINDGSTLLIEQDATGMDKLVASSFDISPDSILELTVGSVQPGAKYAIIQNSDSELAGVDFWNSILTPESSYYWNLSVDGNTLYASLDANAVPEPSTWALLTLGVIALYLRKRVRS